jgi:hypothetical protein
MKYQGINPVGLAIARDTLGEVRDQALQILENYRAVAEQSNSASSLPTTYKRNLAAAQCAQLCAEVVKEFHAECGNAPAEQQG